MTDLTISTDTITERPFASEGEVFDLLHDIVLGKAEFLIVARASEDYIQAAKREDGFLVEWRDGNADSHREAILVGALDGEGTNALDMDSAKGVFSSYIRKAPQPTYVDWRAPELLDTTPVYGYSAVLLVAVVLLGFGFVIFG